MSLGASIESVADAFLATSSIPTGIQPSPVRRLAAIKAIEKDEELSDDEFASVVRMVRRNTEIADSYLAIERKRARTAYLQQEMSDYNRERQN